MQELRRPHVIDDETLYAKWFDASHSAGQPMCVYPQLDTLRMFARVIWAEGRYGPQSAAECPY